MTEPARSPTGRRIRMVWAQAAGGVIGADGGLPWHLPEDLRLFRALTTGGTVVMGRRTWESLPARFRPLPDRRNVVLSTTLDPVPAGVTGARSVADVLALDGDLWVIGGGEVYRALLPHAVEVVVTDVDAQLTGDTVAPPLDRGWALDRRVPATGWAGSTAGLPFRVSWWRRTTAVPDRDPDPGPSAVPAVLAGQALNWSAAGRSGGGVGTGR